MKITLTGTGSLYSRYNSASTLINDDLMIDMPNGIMKELLKYDFDLTKIKTILITHFHGDHIADIAFFLEYIYFLRKEKYKLNIIGPIGIKNKIIELFTAYNFGTEEEFNNDFNLNIVEFVDNTIEINGYKIDSYHVVHGRQTNALGYVINDELGITGDTSLCDGVEKIFERSKLVVSDSSLLVGNKSHLGIDNIEYLINKYNTNVIATHLNEESRKTLIENKLMNVEVVEDFFETNL